MADYQFQVYDYIVGSVVVVVPVAIGVLFAVKDKDKATREEYLLGGRDMHLLPVAMSIFITFMSAVSLIGVPSEVYMYGSMYLWLGLGLGLSYIVGMFSVVPLLYPLRLTSIYEYLYLRYKSQTVRMMSTSMGMLTTILHTGAAALLAPAFALEASAKIPLWVSVVVVGAVGTLYTAIGGIKSVVWTDAFQTVIVFFGIFLMIIKGIIAVGGVSEVYDIANEGGRTMMDNFNPDPRSRMNIYGCIIGGMFMWLVNGFNQSTIQRLGAMKSMKRAKIAFFLNFPFVVFYKIILVILGNVIYAYLVHKKCDPFEAGYISNTNQIAPYFVLDALNDVPGMAGLYVSTLCCGTLSTISSGINALAANSVEDVFKGSLKKYSEARITLITKGFVLFHGCVVICLAYIAQYIKGPVTQMAGTVLAACGSPVLGLFIIGASVPWANKYGAITGAFCAFAFNFWIGIGSMMSGRKLHKLDPGPIDSCNKTATVSIITSSLNLTSNSVNPPYMTTTPMTSDSSYDYGFFLYDISYEWYGFIGTFLSVSIGLIVSYCTRSHESSITEAKYIFPFMRRFYTFENIPVENRTPKGCYELDVKSGILIKNKSYSATPKNIPVNGVTPIEENENNNMMNRGDIPPKESENNIIVSCRVKQSEEHENHIMVNHL